MPQTLADASVITVARRAPRYDIVAPVRYRVGDGPWLSGTTVNLGRAGVLIRTNEPAPLPNTQVDLHVMLTTPRARTGAHVAGSGRVVRTTPADAAGERLIAVDIEMFELRPAACDPDDAHRTDLD